MASAYFTKHLKEGEEAVAVVRATPLAYVIRGLLPAALILLAFFFLFPLFRLGTWGVFGFFLLLLAGLLIGIRLGVLWYYNVFLITSQRIVDFDQHGLLSRTVSECTLGHIQDVRYRLHGPLQMLFRYGDVVVQTASADATLEIEDVGSPKDLAELITTLQQRVATSDEPLTADELVRILERVRATDPATFHRLVGRTRTSASVTEPKKKTRPEA
ncbi:MAG: PH domain-containing protein [Candidatus Kerfeldbacteria bacterium]|nr:PH domain-containing protein [Candidatus Kerfeldbacteria bacterium]